MSGIDAKQQPATLHATVLFHSVAVHQVPPKKALLSFFFSSAPETIILLYGRVNRNIAYTYAMCARGSTCVIDVPRRCAAVCFALYNALSPFLFVVLCLRLTESKEPGGSCTKVAYAQKRGVRPFPRSRSDV